MANLDDFHKTKEILTDQQFKFYTFTPKSEKPVSLILRNYPGYYSEVELQQHLEEAISPGDILRVSKLKSNWLIQLKKGVNVDEVLSIKFLNQNRVFFARYNANNTIVQCKRCQRFGHVASNCNLPHRCVKCGEGHGPGNCTLPPKEQNNEVISVRQPDGTIKTTIGKPVYCILCETHGHTANYRKCAVYKQAKAQKEASSRRQAHRVPIQQQTRPSKRPNMQGPHSFADIVRASTSQPHVTSTNTAPFRMEQPQIVASDSTQPNAFAILNKECGEVFGCDFVSLARKIGTFIPTLQSLQPQDKGLHIFEFVASLVAV